jgi:hypothetical protein
LGTWTGSKPVLNLKFKNCSGFEFDLKSKEI